jgi:hypothetical protein
MLEQGCTQNFTGVAFLNKKKGIISLATRRGCIGGNSGTTPLINKFGCTYNFLLGCGREFDI